MAGNRALYEEALREGAARAWEQRWDEAIAAYQRALQEFPGDPDALSGLGLAFLGAERLEEALQAFQQAAERAEDDPTLMEHTARVLEKLGKPKDAARAYLAAAERHTRRQAPSLALERWKDAVRVDPECIPAHVHLLRAYLSQRKTSEALAEYLALATIYHAQGQTQQALDLCKHALKLDPHNPGILALMDRLRFGEELPPSLPDTGPLDFALEEEEVAERGSPVETARQKALAHLAEAFFDEKPPQTGPLVLRPISKAQVDALISKAINCQTTGDAEEAIVCYEKVLQGGVVDPAVNFNLGLLYQQQLRFEDAIAQFEQAAEEPEYRLGSLFALGECHRALGNTHQSLQYFLEVLKTVDLETVPPDQADDLIRLYDDLARAYTAEDKLDQAVEFVDTLIAFLSQKDWEDKVAQAREQLDELTRGGPVLSLAEVLAVPGSEQILRSLSLAQEYQRRGWGYTALEELYHAIGLAPTFLLIHQEMGQILAGIGRADLAVAKFLTIANTYRVRGNLPYAMMMYEQALRLEPMNTAVRTHLIDLLVANGEIDKALEHYMALGDSYYQLAQLETARETFSEALKLAPQGSPERNWTVRFLHRIGDIDMQRVDWRKAVEVYERIRDLAPDDEKARLTLVDLYYRFNQPHKAVRELDDLLRFYKEGSKAQKVIPLLEDLVEQRPDDIPLRARLAQAHLNAGNVQQALQHLDVLGDLQLQAGRKKDAIVTIKAILRLHPPNADAYRQLLDELTAGRVPG